MQCETLFLQFTVTLSLLEKLSRKAKVLSSVPLQSADGPGLAGLAVTRPQQGYWTVKIQC